MHESTKINLHFLAKAAILLRDDANATKSDIELCIAFIEKKIAAIKEEEKL